jgi:hypothetical protein
MSNFLSQISDEVLATLIALAAAVVGYGIREFLNRARPFFQVLLIDGGVRRLSDRLNLPEETCKKLEAGVVPLRKEIVAGSTTLGDLAEFCDEAQDLMNVWDRIEPLFDILSKATSQAETLEVLPKILQFKVVERWIVLSILGDRLTIPKPADAGEVIPLYFSEERDGTNWLAFPGATFFFGFGLKDAGVSAKMKPFYELIRVVDIDGVKQVVSQIRGLMAAGRHRAAELIHPLKERLNEGSRWRFVVYFANLSSGPMLIGKMGQIAVSEQSLNKPFKEEVYLVLHGEGSSLSDAVTPLVVRPGEDATFSFITTQKQEQMAKGRAFREVFEKGGGRLKIELRLQRVGMFKQQIFRSSAIPFEESERPAAPALNRFQ